MVSALVSISAELLIVVEFVCIKIQNVSTSLNIQQLKVESSNLCSLCVIYKAICIFRTFMSGFMCLLIHDNHISSLKYFIFTLNVLLYLDH